jgi:hypothetical protein
MEIWDCFENQLIHNVKNADPEEKREVIVPIVEDEEREVEAMLLELGVERDLKRFHMTRCTLWKDPMQNAVIVIDMRRTHRKIHLSQWNLHELLPWMCICWVAHCGTLYIMTSPMWSLKSSLQSLNLSMRMTLV